MAKFYLKLLLIILGIGFCIFFGVDLATRGVERVQGPVIRDVNKDSAIYRSQTDELPASRNEAKGQAKQTSRLEEDTVKGDRQPKAIQEPVPRAELADSVGVGRIGNKAGELLQIIAHYGIRWFVALFDAVSG
jgi:hypothetical protein